MIVLDIEYKYKGEAEWRMSKVAIRSRTEEQEYHAIEDDREQLNWLNDRLAEYDLDDDDIIRYFDYSDHAFSPMMTRAGYNDDGDRYRVPNDDYELVDSIEPLFKRWHKAMGGDDPRYDNDLDDFVRWIEYEVVECEVENNTAEWQGAEND